MCANSKGTIIVGDVGQPGEWSSEDGSVGVGEANGIVQVSLGHSQVRSDTHTTLKLEGVLPQVQARVFIEF